MSVHQYSVKTNFCQVLIFAHGRHELSPDGPAVRKMDRDCEDVDACSCGPACLLPAVVSIAATGSGKALDFTKGFVVKKLCSLTTVADSRLSVLDPQRLYLSPLAHGFLQTPVANVNASPFL